MRALRATATRNLVAMGESARQETNRTHVVIIGAGFAGLNATKALAGAAVNITVIDRRNHHLFQPLLYQVATAGLNPSDIAVPIRSILRKQRNARVLLDTVTGIDLSERCVELAEAEPVSFDYLIVAAGATHSYFGNDAWAADAPGLKTIEDALEIRRRILLAFEEAERSKDPTERARLLTFVVVGAGPTGVELAGAIAEIATTTLTRDFRTIDPAVTHVVLVEGGERVLTALSPHLSRKAESQLEAHGVDVRVSTIVTAIDDHGVDTTTGRIESGCVLWAAGVSASPLGALIGVETDRAGRVLVAADLSIPGDSNVFVIGDLATVPWKDGVVPGVAPAAMQQGKHVASLIEGDLAGRRRAPFVYRDKGTLATIGRSSAVASIGRIEFWGFTAWMLWWSIHIAYLIGFRSRAFVLFGWGWSWLTHQRSARLITNPWHPSGSDTT